MRGVFTAHSAAGRRLREQSAWPWPPAADRVARAVPRPLRFVMVGGSGVVVNLVAFAGLHGAGAAAVPAAAGAFAAALANNFWWNRAWTFSARCAGTARRHAARFLTVSAGAFSVTAFAVSVARAEGAALLVAEAVAIAVAAPLSYAANRAWTFAPGTDGPRLEVHG